MRSRLPGRKRRHAAERWASRAELGGHGPEPELVRARANHHDRIKSRWKQVRGQAEGLAHQALRPVAGNGAAHLARGHDAKPGRAVRGCAWGEQQNKVPRAHLEPARLDTDEVPPLPDPESP